jgi:hypothetical protein
MPNSQLTGMIGYERQLAANLTAGIQWQAEYMLDYDIYKSQNESSGSHIRDEIRHLTTLRLTKLMVEELLRLSGFLFYSPGDEDAYLRFSISYKYSDELELALGGNIFEGNHEATEFGQFQKNDNVYLKVTYGF